MLIYKSHLQPLGQFQAEDWLGEPLGEEAAREMEGKGSVIEDMLEVPDGRYRIIHGGYRVWWVVRNRLVSCYPAAVMVCSRSRICSGVGTRIPQLGWPSDWVGLIGTSLSIILYVSSKNFFGDDTEATIGDKLNSLDETLVHAASEIHS